MKRKKLRGSKTAGRGNGQNARKAGSKGGVGRAGSGKRGQQKVFSIDSRVHIKNKRRSNYPLNLWFVEKNLDRLLEKGKIYKKDDFYVIDLKKLGYTKVCGKLTNALKLEVHGKCSRTALDSIKSFGGVVYE
ncbi:MAG: uL15m family ribosomal protein [Candidatus Rehaiarchaeum fermentans]|nr:uL15 family ribosomal protein [Candidatus Rehaiarchaeum fermentans]MCW1302030.1 uL15 family ribosomal protein [Candidatus Rehaiarchaeum fermentans]